jgi:hypothetical protein
VIYVLLGWMPGRKEPNGFSTHTDFSFAMNQFRLMCDGYQYDKVTFNRVKLAKPFEPEIECLGKWEAAH